MGLLLMSERELQRIEVLAQVLDGSLRSATAASLLGLSQRQVQRLLGKVRDEGAMAVRHKLRGRPSNNRIGALKRDYILSLIRSDYPDFGPTLAAEKLAERHGIRISSESLRQWMMAGGLWHSRAQRRRVHQPRLRRQALGELIQIKGSDHRWFEDRGPACTLLVFIDDATGKLMQMRFVPSETTEAYFAALEGYLAEHGRPVAFYSDKHSIFRINRPEVRNGHAMTQFGRALAELNIEILCANSSQAKGRVERANRTLQDRLVKELRLAGISDMEAANAFLPGFMARHNERFAYTPAHSDDQHRPLNVPASRLREILCIRDQRRLSGNLVIHYERRKFILNDSEHARSAIGQYVETYAYPDRPLEIRWKGFLLPYRVFDPSQQRVTHASITENKRLAEVLSYIMIQQQTNPPQVGPVGKQRDYYTPTGKRGRGRKSWLDKRAERRAAEAQAAQVLQRPVQ
ncbi:ISNCY family transposase [Paracoccus aerius]|uniref:ISNCY family transposase n=1 Tax=Paracoccus aerius TaxID=1915382 RepID=A0ABS1S7Z6_9RHOB|nr:ISNCY family transposase [Paracoccus aerius]MBL3674833.1 ISNCY family transposase [Paracoccus aerius]GHG29372.1 transposase [Paracoccus aerius]